MSLGVWILVAAIVAAVYMAWNIGANDVANAMGTSVGSGALTLTGAIILAGVLEFSGSVIMGSSVSSTVGKGIVDVALFAPDGALGPDGPMLLALAMVSALIGASLWLHLATHLGLPVSTTHSIVGAVVGVGVIQFGVHGVHWAKMAQIVASWFVSPVLGGILAFLSFVSIRAFILNARDPVAATKRYSPFLVGAVVMVMVLSFIYKVLKNKMGAPPALLGFGIGLGAGAVAAVLASALVRNTGPRPGRSPYQYVERIFAMLQIATAGFVAFAHGANDVANAVGPIATVVALFRQGYRELTAQIPVPLWILVIGGGGIVFGLATLGYKVIATIGGEITDVTPTRGFSAEFGAATTVLVASSLGLPISTTHTLVGGVIGVGLAQGITALNMRMIRNIVNSWLATVPVAAAAAALLYELARVLLL